jgi:3-hydroxyisobutyrate dehydrogenase-like beta-hydroxyacid dehydrogenase
MSLAEETHIFAGLGHLGRAMAEALEVAGFSFCHYNRTIAKAAGLKGFASDDFANVLRKRTAKGVVFCMLNDYSAIREVMFGSEPVKQLLNGVTVVNMATIGPAESIALGDALETVGARLVEAPVLGSINEAKNRKIQIMLTANDPAVLKSLRPLLESFCGNIVQVGTTYGKSCALKLALNNLILSLTASFSTSLGIVERNAIDVDLFMSIVSQSAVFAPQYTKKMDKFMSHDYSQNVTFSLANMLKDGLLVQDECRRVGLHTPHVQDFCSMMQKGCEEGHANDDYSSLSEVIRNPSNQ